MAQVINNINNRKNTFYLQDTISGYTTNEGVVSNLAIGNVDITTGTTANITINPLINIFFPIGTYYETSDSSFDPNVSWGGTWVLETEGKVHLSAGSDYAIGSSGGAVSQTYTPTTDVVESGVYKLNNTSLTSTQVPAHTHGAATVATGNKSWQFYVRRYATSTSTTATLTQTVWASTNSTISQLTSSGGRFVNTAADSLAGYRDLVKFDNTHTHTSVGSGKAHNHTFTGTQATINKMQPYIAVNRWHRTA